MNWWIPILLLAWFLNSERARAVILFGTGNPSANNTPPQGTLAGSGWDWQIDPPGGGTLVGPSHVLTAAHLGYWTNTTFTWRGLTYRVLESVGPPETDLRLLRVAGRFGTWAPTFAGTNEVEKPVVIFGHGSLRGAPISVTEEGQSKLRGWRWGALDLRLRWGTNVIESIETGGPDNPGEYLAALFTDDAGDDEATVSTGDSGGGVFLQNQDRWELAGVLSSVEGDFKERPDWGVFNAALFDRRNFLEQLSPEVWGYDPSRFERPGTFWLATRVSTYRDWLESQLAQAPAFPLPRLLSSPTLQGLFQEYPTYSIDPSVRRINLIRPGDEPIFFQLEGESTARVLGATGETLTLEY